MPDIIDINTLFGPWPAAATDLSVDELLKLMQKHGIQSACTLSTVGLLLDHNLGNSATRAACSEHTNLIPTATVNPRAYYGELNTDGFRLLRVFPAVQGWHPDAAPFPALAETIGSTSLPIMADVDGTGSATQVVKAAVPYAAAIILAGVDESCLAETVGLMKANASVFVETSGMLSAGALKFVVNAVGADRVLYGSGAPARPMAGVLGVLKHSGLGDTESAAVLGGNARRVLGL